MNLKINIALDNAAFTDSLSIEINQILGSIGLKLPIDHIDAAGWQMRLLDSNGNFVGYAEIENDEEP